MSWISVTERLPENNSLVMACYHNDNHKGVIAGVYSDGEWNGIIVGFYPTAEVIDEELKSTVHFHTSGPVTHWMPLPSPPEEA